MNGPDRDIREIVRDEPVMHDRILEVLADGPHTIPEIAEALGQPAHEAMYWVMGMRRYGWIRELKDVGPEGYFRYQAVQKEARP